MINSKNYIPQKDRKKILILSDDMRFFSGIATQTREFVLGLSNKYNFVQLGGAAKHPEDGKVSDLSAAINKETGLTDSYCKIYSITGYGNPELLKQVMGIERPDAIFIFTDPRFWIWLFNIEREIRQHVPILYWNIWDCTPFPMYNYPYYKSCDLLMGISRQTVNINKNVLSEKDWISVEDVANGSPVDGKTVISYVPHGVNPTIFKPLDKVEVDAKKKEFFGGKDYKYVLFYNNRNITRKRTQNIMLGYRAFCDNLSPEDAKSCVMVFHTNIVDDAGTDLQAVKDALCPKYNVVFSTSKISPQDLNVLYNIADVTVSATSNEGWGIGTTESIMAGTPTIMPVTGGQQDQIGQTDCDGNPLQFDKNWGSNADGRVGRHGPWVKPLYPSVRTLQGSPLTPYIFDDLVSWEDIAVAMMYWWRVGPEYREKAGLIGRNWGIDGNLSSENMCEKMLTAIDLTLKNWKPRSKFSIHKEDEFVGNKMFDQNCPGFVIPDIDIASIDEQVDELKHKIDSTK